MADTWKNSLCSQWLMSSAELWGGKFHKQVYFIPVLPGWDPRNGSILSKGLSDFNMYHFWLLFLLYKHTGRNVVR